MGFLRRLFLKSDMRRKSDRRKKVDPRFRDQAYPDFVERRNGRDRRCEQEYCRPSFLAEHAPARKPMILIGVVAALLLTYLFSLTCFNLCSSPSATNPKRSGNPPIIAF